MGRPRQHHFIEQENPAVQAAGFTEGVTLESPLPDLSAVNEEVASTVANFPDSRWREIDSGATSGMPHYVSDTAIGDGTLAFFKRTRAFANKRWTEVGKFVDYMTGVDLKFTPKFCRNRYE